MPLCYYIFFCDCFSYCFWQIENQFNKKSIIVLSFVCLLKSRLAWVYFCSWFPRPSTCTIVCTYIIADAYLIIRAYIIVTSRVSCINLRSQYCKTSSQLSFCIMR